MSEVRSIHGGEEGMETGDSGVNVVTMARIKLPAFSPISPEELDQRRRLVADVRALRDEIGPIGLPVDDLVHEARGEDERFDERQA